MPRAGYSQTHADEIDCRISVSVHKKRDALSDDLMNLGKDGFQPS